MIGGIDDQMFDAEGGEDFGPLIHSGQEWRGLCGTEERDGMGIEGEDDRGESVVGRLLDKRTEHQLVTEMDAIKIADGNVSSASGRRFGESKVPVHG